MTADEIKARREVLAAKRAQLESDAAAQAEIDDLEIEELRFKYGAIGTVRIVPYREGLPTRVAFRCPTRAEVKSFQAKIARASARKSAADLVPHIEARALECLIYPATTEERELVLDAVPEILGSGAQIIAKISSGEEEDEGKG